MALGVGLLTIGASVATHQFFWRSMNAGVLARCALISSLYKRGLKLTPKARSKHSNAALINHMSTDISRIDYAAAWFHAVWTAPIQVLVCLALLIVQLGPSALAGFAVFVILVPIQQRFMAFQITKRKKSMKWTDERAKLLQELLGAMRVIKYFCYEVPFLQRIDGVRHEELKGIASISLIKSANGAIAFSVPHVGEALFNNAILGALKNKGKTVILVTHALHFLHHVDYIYNIVDGKIVEQGTYDQLVKNGQAFSRLLQEFSGQRHGPKDDETVEEELSEKSKKKKSEVTLSEFRKKIDLKTLGKAVGTGKIEGRLMKSEKRSVGSIEMNVYSTYLKAGQGWWTVPLIILSAVLMQGTAVVSTYWLIWWQTDSFHKSTKFYMALYAVLGVAQSAFLYVFGAVMSLLSLYACRNLHNQAVHKIFHAPMSFFDTTPLGRILSIFGKDVDVLDNNLVDALRLFAITLVSALGSVIIITYVLHYFIIAICAVVVGY
ncbi:hypothetical protein FRB90_006577, partial [Tulasnella sp. 427]